MIDIKALSPDGATEIARTDRLGGHILPALRALGGRGDAFRALPGPAKIVRPVGPASDTSFFPETWHLFALWARPNTKDV